MASPEKSPFVKQTLCMGGVANDGGYIQKGVWDFQ